MKSFWPNESTLKLNYARNNKLSARTDPLVNDSF